MTQKISTESILVKYFSRVELNWSDFNFLDSGKMSWLILQQWFCSVRSPCITEAMH